MRSRTSVALTAVVLAALVVATLFLPRTSADTGPSPVGTTALHPVPQEWSRSGVEVPLTGRVEVVGQDLPEEVTALATTLIREAGGTPADRAPTRLALGIGAGSQPLPATLTLPGEPEGYVITTTSQQGVPTITVVGTDADGLVHGLQTLRQLARGGTVPATTIRDWPLMPIRGVVEGFYGAPWTLQERIDMVRWAARYKLNTYMYAPKDDAHLRAQWRDPYPQQTLDELAALAREARASHVRLIGTLSPGQDICYLGESDFQAAVAKLEALREVGFTAFSIALDDIDPTRMCPQDLDGVKGGDPKVQVARAQAHFVNRIQREYLTPKGLPDLVLTPTKYHGLDPDPARTALSQDLDPVVTQVWTGDGIVDEEITSAEVTTATSTFAGSKLLLWDNFPVNDGDLDRLFLGTLPHRDPALHEVLEGVLTNPMLQAHASMPAVAAYGGLTWNGPTFDPVAARQAAIDELIGQPQQPHVAALIDLLSSWAYSAEPTPSQLSADIIAFNDALATGSFDAAEQALRTRLELLKGAPAALGSATSAEFAADLRPWAGAAAAWADAASEAIAVRRAVASGDPASAEQPLLRLSEHRWAATTPIDGVVPELGDGVLARFVGEAEAAWEKATGRAAPEVETAARASTNLGQWEEHPVAAVIDGDPSTAWVSRFGPSEGSQVTVDLGRERPLSRVQVLQGGDGDAAEDHLHDGVLEVSADGANWQPLGRISQASVDLKAPAGTRARYLRLTAKDANPDGQWVQVNEVIVS